LLDQIAEFTREQTNRQQRKNWFLSSKNGVAHHRMRAVTENLAEKLP
jgi:hypothetical protein